MRRFVLLALVAASLLACREPTEITLQVTTDIPCTSLLGISVTAGSFQDIEGLPPATIATECSSDGNIGSIVVVPSGADDAAIAVRVVGGKGQDVESCTAPKYGPPAPSPTGCVVARRVLSFEPHDPLYLPIVLRDACVGVSCPLDETCVDGSCKDATVQNPDLCDDPTACGESSLSPGSRDGGTPDSGTPDSGTPDSGTPDSGTPDSGTPDGGSPSPVVEVAASTHGTSCARTMSGKIYCWGSNDSGKLGMGGSAEDLVPVTQAMSTVSDPASMGLAAGFFCVLSSSGGVVCAGDGSEGQLGNGVSGSSTTPVGVEMLSSVTGLGVGANHACALMPPQIFCWGAGTSNQLGPGSSMANSSMPQGQSIGNTVAVAAGGDTSCALESPGGIVCWGSNLQGQLDTDPMKTPTDAIGHSVSIATPPTAVSVGSSAACALVGGQGQCWGEVDGANISQPLVALGAFSDITQIALGGSGGCARRTKGTVFCWGANDAGQLGLGTTDLATTFPPVNLVLGIDDAVSIARSADHACVARSSGKVSCWGDNTTAQVSGDGVPTSHEATPVDVPLPE